MKSFYSTVLLISVLALSNAGAQTPALRGIYIDKFSQILGNTNKEDSLLHYAQDSSFNYLALYDLHNISFTNATTVGKLASFIRNARENYGIQYIGAVGETFSSFQSKIAPYNNGRSNPNERFNVFNLEFEFWISSSVNPGAYYCTQYLIQNNCSCDTSGAFKFYIDQMRKIDSLATIQNALSETYVGWFNQGQGQQIAQNTDRVLVHAYRTSSSSVFGYSKTRLSYLASLSQQVDVAPIFSSEPDFMGPWLTSKSLTEPYSQFIADFNSDNSSWKPYIRLLGYQWFDYGYMPKPVPGTSPTFTPTISASGATNFCNGGSVTLTASAGSNYLWSNGATTPSINVNSSGTFTCQVTQGGVTKTTSAVSVNANSLPSASFAVGNTSTSGVTLSSTSTAGGGSISAYQWYYNGFAIGGANSSTYTASSDGNYALSVTNSNGCSHTCTSQNIIIPVSACSLTTPSGCASLNLSSTSVMLSWSNLPSCDSVIVRYKMEGANAYTYIRLPYTGNNIVTLTGVVPNARYSWRVKTSCGGSYSGYSSKKYFSTHSATVSIAYAPEARIESIETEQKQVSRELLTYPNPARDHLKMDFFAELDGNAEVMLMDMTGRAMISKNVTVMEGENSITLNTSDIPSGFYLSIIKTGNINLLKRVLIQN